MIRDTARPTSPRGGFTLIELLVVIGIMALLAALVAAGVGRIRVTQMSKTTEQTLAKLQGMIDQQWKAVLDQVKQDKIQNKIPPPIVQFCDNDTDRAEALWAYMNLKREFPQTFAEARTAVQINGYTLQPRATYASVPATSTGSPEAEAAVLLYLNVSEMGRRGMTTPTDDAFASAQSEIDLGGGKFRVFRDAWGTPITFIRFAQNAELDALPFVNPKDSYKDPMDNRGKLAGWSNTTNRTLVLGALNTAGAPAVAFDSRNKIPTVVSAGPDKAFQLGNPPGLGALSSDDIYGYRLKQLGARGD
jgi:prepilin-type N-terminal cleavage/methylation domain-containing protein